MEHKMDKTDGEDLKERLSDLESNHEELESTQEELDSKHEELSERVEDWKIARVSLRMQTPASMISRAKTGSSNHRRARSG